MNTVKNKELAKRKRLQNFYNTIPNLFWSVLCLVPIMMFCYQLMQVKWFSVFLAISIFSLFLPNTFFDKMQLANTTTIYKKLGVHRVNKFVQNGDIINSRIRKETPDFKVISLNRLSVKKLLQQTYIFEKFHFMLFMFFILAMLYALIKQYYVWTFILLFTNLLYNVYPNLLQQYIRVKTEEI